MKKIFTLLIILILFLGCSTNNDDSNSTTNTVVDIDGNSYQIINICNQKWTKKNLNVSHYKNGDITTTLPNQANNQIQGAWCYINDPANETTYGKLYNWYAVNDPRGLAMTGWHIPTDSEWTTLTDCLGGMSVAGGKMKEESTLHWWDSNTNATNSSGFTGLPGGGRRPDGESIYIGGFGIW
ncbi:MAG: fibrobacter succinogenes major paralogous domain-containing protein [Flavobacterium sp.]|nr:fibrobacter succinogenes major paralogous domain-containing protein [Flavobacterium sp.]